MNLKNMRPQSTDNVTALPRRLLHWEKMCVHDIVDICRTENIPLSFGLPYFHLLRNLYKVAYEPATRTRLDNH